MPELDNAPILDIPPNPHTKELQTRMAGMSFTPDYLSAASAVLNFYIKTNPVEHLSSEQKKIIALLQNILPELIQPANIFLDAEQEQSAPTKIWSASENVVGLQYATPNTSPNGSPEQKRVKGAFAANITVVGMESLAANAWTATANAVGVNFEKPVPLDGKTMPTVDSAWTGRASMSAVQYADPNSMQHPLPKLIVKLVNLANNLASNIDVPQKISDAVKIILNIYREAWSQWQVAEPQLRAELMTPKAEFISESFQNESLGFCYLDAPAGRDLLSFDEEGEVRKKNADGNRPVTKSNNIFFKLNPKRDHIAPGAEFTIATLLRLVAGYPIAPETTLGVMSDVLAFPVDKQSTQPAAYQQYSAERNEGKSIQEVLQNNPALSHQIVRKTTQVRGVVQASQGMGDMPLDKLLALQQKFIWMHEQLGDNDQKQSNFFAWLPSIIDGTIFKDFITQNKGKTKKQLLVDLLILMKQEPLKNFKNFSRNDLNKIDVEKLSEGEIVIPVADSTAQQKETDGGLFNTFERMIKGLSEEEILKCFALASWWPQLMEEQYFGDLARVPKLFESLPGLFPNKQPQDIYDELNDFFSHLDPYNVTALLVGNLLVNPCDGKADNYMVGFVRDDAGKIISIYLIPIDNDQGLGPAITRNKKNGPHDINFKDILPFFKEAMQKPISQLFVDHFLSQTPEVILLKWLSALYQQNLRYERLIFLDKLRSVDLYEESGEPALDILIYLDPKIVPLLHFKLQELQKLISANRYMTNQALLEAMEPIVASFYQAVQEQKKDPLASYSYLHRGDDKPGALVPTVEEVLKNQLDCRVEVRLPECSDSSKKTIAEALQLYTERASDIELKRTQPVPTATQELIAKIDFKSHTQVWELLKLIGEGLPFIKKLPGISQQQLDEYLKEAVKGRWINNAYVHDVSVVKALLQVGADVNAIDIQGNNLLHLALECENPSDELKKIIEILLATPKRKRNAQNQLGKTPIFSCQNSEVLALLLRYGEDIDYWNDKNPSSPTILTDVIVRKDWQRFIELVNQHKAGRNIDAQLALDFVDGCIAYCKKDANYSGWIEQFEYARNVLINQNPYFARLALTKKMTEKEQGASLEMTGLYSGKIQVNAQTAKQLFDEHTGEPKRDNTFGRRAIAKIKQGDHILAWAKFYPELPLFEATSAKLAEMLARKFGTTSCVAASELFGFQGKDKKTYAMSISQNVPGRNLQEFVEVPQLEKDLNQNLDQKSFTELLFFLLLINPEDGKFDQFIVEEFINSKGQKAYRLRSVDNDHIFAEPVVREDDGHRKVQIKAGPYLLDAMLKPLDEEACEKFLELEPEQFLKEWLNELIKIDDAKAKLFSSDDIKRLLELANTEATEIEKNKGKKQDKKVDAKGSILSMPFTSRIITSLLERFQRIKQTIKENRENKKLMEKESPEKNNLTGLKLLRQVIPAVGVVVEEKFKLADQENNPNTRFSKLWGDEYEKDNVQNSGESVQLYSEIVAQRYKTKVSTREVLGSSNIPVKSVLKNAHKFGPREALAVLESSKHEANTVGKVKADIVRGDIKPFVDLHLDSTREKVLEELCALSNEKSAFNTLKPDMQRKVLKSLKGSALTTLNLANCKSIEWSLLEEILKSLPNLRRLNISGCTKIPAGILSVLAEYCPTVEVLDFNDLHWDAIEDKKKPVVLPNLRRLSVARCNALQRISVVGPQLETLDTEDSLCLHTVELQGHKLKSLFLKNNPKLSEESIKNLIGQSLELLKHPQRVSLDKDKLLPPREIIRLCASYRDPKIWTVDHAKLIQENPMLNLIGSQLTDADLIVLAPHLSGVKNINLQGTKVSGLGLAALIKHAKNLEKIVLNNYALLAGKPGVPVGTQGFPQEHGERKRIEALTVNPNGELLVAGANTKIKLFDQHGKPKLKDDGSLQDFEVPQTFVSAVTALPNGNIVGAALDKRIYVFHKLTGECLQTLIGHTKAITGVQYFPEVQKLVSVSKDTSIKLWDVKSGKCLHTLGRGLSEIRTLEALSAEEFAVGCDDGTVTVWNIKTAACTQTIKVPGGRAANVIKKISSNIVAVAGLNYVEEKIGEEVVKDYTITILDLTTGETLNTIKAHKSPITCMEFLGRWLATGSEDKTVKIWDLMTGECVQIFQHADPVTSLTAMSHNRLATATTKGQINFWQFMQKEVKLDLVNKYKGDIFVEKSKTVIKVKFNAACEEGFLKQFSGVIAALTGYAEEAIQILSENEIQFVTDNAEQFNLILDLIVAMARDNRVIQKDNLNLWQAPRVSTTILNLQSQRLSTSTSTPNSLLIPPPHNSALQTPIQNDGIPAQPPVYPAPVSQPIPVSPTAASQVGLHALQRARSTNFRGSIPIPQVQQQQPQAPHPIPDNTGNNSNAAASFSQPRPPGGY